MKRQPSPRRKPSASGPASGAATAGDRLQKVLAAAGLGSRRACEELIVSGRVEIDRQVVTELGTRVDPVQQEIRVDGTALPRQRRLYYALNKPSGVLCTNQDPSGRTRAIDLIDTEDRLFTVGRLDLYSEGLILLTNDGDLANRLTHPRYGVEKTYHVQVAGEPTQEQLAQLRKGVYLAEGVARVARVTVRHRHRHHTELEIVLCEGRNREIRRVLARLGHKVLRLRRIAVGPLRLGDLPSGSYRTLKGHEVRMLQALGTERRRPGRPPPAAASASRSGAASRSSAASRSGAARPARKPGAGSVGRRRGDRTGAVLGADGGGPTRPAQGLPWKKKNRP